MHFYYILDHFINIFLNPESPASEMIYSESFSVI
jgi:hypothetical protein